MQDHKNLRLTGIEQAEYVRKYPHIAPEIVEGRHSYSFKSDIFSAGGIIFQLGDNKLFSSSMKSWNLLKCVGSFDTYSVVKL